jgi:hypothetical protein
LDALQALLKRGGVKGIGREYFLAVIGVLATISKFPKVTAIDT